MSDRQYYNGFSPAERTIGARLIRKATASGALRQSCSCSVCKRTFDHALKWHSEDYHDPMAAYAICSRCHYAIHIRFRRPDYWRAYIAALDRSGWFQSLATDPEVLSRPFDLTYPMGIAGWR